MGIIKKFFSIPWKTINAPLADGKKSARQLKKGLGAVVTDMRANRDPKAEDAPDLSDFNAVLEHWQIEPEQVKKVIRGLKARMLLFGLMGAYGGVYLLKGIFDSKPLWIISGLALGALGVTAALTGAWRISVLKKQRFEP